MVYKSRLNSFPYLCSISLTLQIQKCNIMRQEGIMPPAVHGVAFLLVT